MPQHRTDETVSSDDRTEAHAAHVDAPWWAGIGPLGAVGLVVLGVAAGCWFFLGLPGTPDVTGAGYVSAGKVVAVGLVLSGTAALDRFRNRRASRADDGA